MERRDCGEVEPSIACIDLPALPLQILLGRESAWRGQPVAVVDRDEPQGRILWVNERARQMRILPGRRYAEALAIASELRAGVVEAEAIDEAVRSVLRVLEEFSPVVEPSSREPGVFWLNARGLRDVFPSKRVWMESAIERIASLGFFARAVIGHTRFGAHALTRVLGPRRLLESGSPSEETAAVDPVPLARLGIEPRLRDALDRLGIDTVGGLRRLPAGGLLERFGRDAHGLHELVLGRLVEPLVGQRVLDPVRDVHRRDPEDPRLDHEALLALAAQSIHRCCTALAERGESLRAFTLTIVLDGMDPLTTRIELAEPSLEPRRAIELLRLRLEVVMRTVATPKRLVEIEEFVIECESVTATVTQLELFVEASRRDPKDGARVLDRLRARFGDDSIGVLSCRSGHLPEARFRVERLSALPLVRAETEPQPTLVRRIFTRAPSASDQRPGPDGWFLVGPSAGPVRRLHGPYVISGGWWVAEQHREYHFAETANGEIHWLFYDRARRRWFLHGRVE
ncbi:MAG: DNA polymerase Y family protein [Planctomycetota bacterium]